jgi:hypothetical protein
LDLRVNVISLYLRNMLLPIIFFICEAEKVICNLWYACQVVCFAVIDLILSVHVLSANPKDSSS